MRNFTEAAKRILVQVDFVLSMKALAAIVVAAVFSVLLSIGVATRAVEVVIGILTFIAILVEFVLLIFALGLIDEISSGEAQVYLATGLERVEYVASWVASMIAYPVLALLLGILIPVLVIDPSMLTLTLSISASTHKPSLGLYTVAIISQILNHFSLSLLLGIVTRRKAVAVLTLATLAVLLPLFISILISILYAFYYYYELYARIFAYTMLPFSPLYVITASGLDFIPEPVVIAVPLALATASLALTIYFAKKSLEV